MGERTKKKASGGKAGFLEVAVAFTKAPRRAKPKAEHASRLELLHVALSEH